MTLRRREAAKLRDERTRKAIIPEVVIDSEVLHIKGYNLQEDGAYLYENRDVVASAVAMCPYTGKKILGSGVTAEDAVKDVRRQIFDNAPDRVQKFMQSYGKAL